jgi:hypothetical protein
MTGAYETKLWVLGQIGAARQAMNLLQQRAGGGERSVWPEFSELHCFDCHHSLGGEPAWSSSGNRPGVPFWGTWSYPLLPLVAAEIDGPNLSGPDSPLTRLEHAMMRPYPDRAEVQRLAAALGDQLEDWTARLSARGGWDDDAKRLLDVVAESGPSLVERNWDAAAQTYLAVSALGAARTAGGSDDPVGEAIRTATRTMHEALQSQTGEEAGSAAAPGGPGGRVRVMIEELTRLQEQLGR